MTMFLVRHLRSGHLRDKPFRDLHSIRRFRKVLDRERARSDRSGDAFSLLSLGVKDWDEGRETLVHLAKALRRRLRLTDEAGWLDHRHIGVVLPCTPPWGAWTLADDLCLSFPTNVPLPECNVLCYPSDILPTETGRREPGESHRTRKGGHRPVEAMDVLFVRHLPAWKRGLDIVGAAVGLALVMPLLLLVALAVKLTSRGPVVFAQQRSGLGGKPFAIYKFRSMVADAEQRQAALMALNEQDGPAFKIKTDPRVTWIGKILRATSVDELPQLWNVLKGDMSLVGPRPLPCHEAEACRGWQRRRLDVTPGVTCIWQVFGRSRVSFAEWVRMDVRYARSRSLWADVKLLALTLPALVLRRGV